MLVYQRVSEKTIKKENTEIPTLPLFAAAPHLLSRTTAPARQTTSTSLGQQ